MTSSEPQDSASSASAITVTTVMGKNFSVERYYMLSEIEQHALRPVYLDDYYCPDVDDTAEGDTVATVTSEHYQCDLPPFIILYLLWNCNSAATSSGRTAGEEAQAFQRDSLEKALSKLESLSEKVDQCREKEKEETKKESEESSPLSNVYVVVDALLWSDSDSNNEEGGSNTIDDPARKERFQKHSSIVQALARRILLTNNDKKDSESGIRIVGASVGLADHARAAPGLESCLQAILVGGRDRRRHGGKHGNDNGKSCVGIVCHSLQDLVGYDEETETDAVQGVLQSLTHASFAANTDDNNNSNSHQEPPLPVVDYAHKAHTYWRVHKAGLPPEPTLEEKRAYERDGLDSKSSSNVWILALLVLLAAYYWNNE